MKIFVLSLPHEKMRRSDVEIKLKSIGLKYEICDAFDGRDMQSEQYEKQIDEPKMNALAERALSKQEVACWLGHKEIWHRIATENHDFALVLEDDFFFSRPPLDFFNVIHILSTVSKQSLFLKIDGACQSGPTIGQIGDFRVHLSNRSSPRTMGYIVGSKAAASLLCSFPRAAVPIDNALKRFWDYQVPMVSLSPQLIVENAYRFPSSIETSRVTEKHSVKLRLFKKWRVNFRNFIFRNLRRRRIEDYETLVVLRDELKILNNEN